MHTLRTRHRTLEALARGSQYHYSAAGCMLHCSVIPGVSQSLKANCQEVCGSTFSHTSEKLNQQIQISTHARPSVFLLPYHHTRSISRILLMLIPPIQTCFIGVSSIIVVCHLYLIVSIALRICSISTSHNGQLCHVLNCASCILYPM